MKMLEHTLRVRKTAHVYTLGKLNAETKVAWLICHGYGQTADRFLSKFDVLPEHHFVVAPEALNTFYWHGPERHPVASWMTRRHRLDEISDYLDYLDEVRATYLNLPVGCKLILFGFSQGCATITRYAFQRSHPADHLILWGGDFARDVNYESRNIPHIWHVVGDQDEFITKEKYQTEQEFARSKSLEVNYFSFKGQHRLVPEVLQQVVQELDTTA